MNVKAKAKHSLREMASGRSSLVAGVAESTQYTGSETTTVCVMPADTELASAIGEILSEAGGKLSKPEGTSAGMRMQLTMPENGFAATPEAMVDYDEKHPLQSVFVLAVDKGLLRKFESQL